MTIMLSAHPNKSVALTEESIRKVRVCFKYEYDTFI